MANATYDALWQEAVGELGEQLHVEGADDGEDEGGGNVRDYSFWLRYIRLTYPS